jgi:translation initiation factor IF-3
MCSHVMSQAEPRSHPSRLSGSRVRSTSGTLVPGGVAPVRDVTGRAGPCMRELRGGGFLVGAPRQASDLSRVMVERRRPQQTYRGGPISVEPRVNEQIRAREVRLVGPEGEQVGIVPLERALQLAADVDLDLVEVAPMARPPVCKLMDFGKFKYESALKAREARRNQQQTVIKEMKLRPKIDPHDYETKKAHVVRFLKQGDKVKVTIMFRGREQSRPELGFRLLSRLSTEVAELGFVEAQAKQDGRNMIMVLAPHRATKVAAAAAHAAKDGRSDAPEGGDLADNSAA